MDLKRFKPTSENVDRFLEKRSHKLSSSLKESTDITIIENYQVIFNSIENEQTQTNIHYYILEY